MPTLTTTQPELMLCFICSHEGSDTPANSSDIKVLISSLRSHVLKLKVQKKPDKLNVDLLAEDDSNSGLWNSITRYVQYYHFISSYLVTFIYLCMHACYQSIEVYTM